MVYLAGSLSDEKKERKTGVNHTPNPMQLIRRTSDELCAMLRHDDRKKGKR
jgi:hypothetical protein